MRLMRGIIPAPLINDNFIKGYKSSNEIYMTEFANCSELLLSKSCGELYTHVPAEKQSNGECDCHSKLYDFDIKVLCTQTSMYANATLSNNLVLSSNGVVYELIPSRTEGMNVGIVQALVKSYSYAELENIYTSGSNKTGSNNYNPDADVEAILKTICCKKNVLFLYSDYIYCDDEATIEDVIRETQDHLNSCFKELFRFREEHVPNKDSYLAVLIQGKMCVGQIVSSKLVFQDIISPRLSSTFWEYLNYVNPFCHLKHVILSMDK